MTEMLEPMPPASQYEPPRTRRKLPKWAKWSLISLTVWLSVVLLALNFLWLQPRAREQRAKAATTSYLKAHGALVNIWVPLKGPSADSLGVDGKGDVVAFGGNGGGHLWGVTPAGTVSRQRLTSPVSPPPFFRFAVASDGAAYTVSLGTGHDPSRAITRVSASGHVALSWEPLSSPAWDLTTSRDRLIGLQRRTPDDKSFRIVEFFGGSTKPQILMQHHGDPFGVTASRAGDLYIAGQDPNTDSVTIDHVTADGQYASGWASLPRVLPKGTPPLLKTFIELNPALPASGLLHMSVAPDGTLYATTGWFVYHFNAAGTVMGSWCVATPTGQTTTITDLAVAPDGTVYALGYIPNAEMLPGDSAIAKLTLQPQAE